MMAFAVPCWHAGDGAATDTPQPPVNRDSSPEISCAFVDKVKVIPNTWVTDSGCAGKRPA